MNRKEFGIFTAALKTYYSKEANLIPNNQAMELWFNQLKDIPYHVAETVLNKWVATNKWSPSIADIREAAADITTAQIPDWSEAWFQTMKAIRKYGTYEARRALESLDPLTRTVVKRLGYRYLCLSEDTTADRANFRMIYEAMAKREKEQQQLPTELKDVIESMRIEGESNESKRISTSDKKVRQID